LCGIQSCPCYRPQIITKLSLQDRDGRIRRPADAARHPRSQKLGGGVKPETVKGRLRGAGGGLDAGAFDVAGEDRIRHHRHPRAAERFRASRDVIIDLRRDFGAIGVRRQTCLGRDAAQRLAQPVA